MTLRAVLILSIAVTLAACSEPAPPVPEPAPIEATPDEAAPIESNIAPAQVYGFRLSPADDRYPPGELALRKVDACNIESVAGNAYLGTEPVVVSRSAAVAVNGWLFDRTHSTLAVGTSLVIEKNDRSQRWEAIGVTRVARQDVVDGNGLTADLLDSGFTVELDMSTLEPGEYHLFLAYDAAGEHVICDNARLMVLQ